MTHEGFKGRVVAVQQKNNSRTSHYRNRQIIVVPLAICGIELNFTPCGHHGRANVEGGCLRRNFPVIHSSTYYLQGIL